TITNREFYEFVNNEYSLVENVTIDSNDTQGFSLYDIDSLKTITITKDVTYLEKGFFDGIASIYNLSNIIFESKENWSVYSTTDKSNITQITIPSNFNELKTLIEQYSSYYWEKVN
ncbi:MAG: hypothetical protein IJW82_05065, partial [Clostridia bacterium]|nr:hypothetical protein [Clostridia bacterium]